MSGPSSNSSGSVSLKYVSVGLRRFSSIPSTSQLLPQLSRPPSVYSKMSLLPPEMSNGLPESLQGRLKFSSMASPDLPHDWVFASLPSEAAYFFSCQYCLYCIPQLWCPAVASRITATTCNGPAVLL